MLVALVGLVLADVVLLGLPRELSRPILEEGGPVEFASAALYLTAALATGWLAFRGRPLMPAATLVLVLCLAREMDLHDRFTSQGITRLRFYTSASTPLVEKMLVIGVIGAVLWLLYGPARDLASSLRAGVRPPAGLLWGAGVLIGAQLLDRVVRLLVYDLGMAADATLPFLGFLLEETAEMAAPLLFLTAVPMAAASSPVAAADGAPVPPKVPVEGRG